ncbi:MAG TPA: hypothetical protein VKI19_07080 [Acidimicrobiales bacterium]|nr:hypothetical protein [Acidimicrobiales bacterium]
MGPKGLGLHLPVHHIRRPHLTDRCRDERIVVVEASAGYGKSVLAAELVDTWGTVPVEVLLDESGVSAGLLASRLRAAVQRAGFVDAAASMAETGEDAVGAVDAMLAALADESCAFVIDDAHNAMRDAGLLCDRIAARTTGAQRFLLLARQLPPGAERMRRADALHIGANDLAFDEDETLQLCRSGFGLDTSAEDVRFLDAVTGGWTAAVVLAASRARRTGQPIRAVAVAGFDPIAAILDELIAPRDREIGLGPDRAPAAGRRRVAVPGDRRRELPPSGRRSRTALDRGRRRVVAASRPGARPPRHPRHSGAGSAGRCGRLLRRSGGDRDGAADAPRRR